LLPIVNEFFPVGDKHIAEMRILTAINLPNTAPTFRTAATFLIIDSETADKPLSCQIENAQLQGSIIHRDETEN
jgi:hypothetical protein